MIPVASKILATAALAAVLLCPIATRAAIEADPQVLYNEMKAAYQKAAERNWDFVSQEQYLSTILDAGRAYSLQRPNDPAYGEIATLTIQVGSGLHYDPLTDHNGATWYVREAANWIINNSGSPQLISEARVLLERVNAEDSPATLARLADGDAADNAHDYPGDVDAALQQVEANWRSWLLTGDPSWRSLAFQRAANPNFPLAHLPTSYGPEFVRAAQMASAGTLSQDAPGDKANADTIVTRLKNLTSPLIIASVKSVPHDVYLSTLAPADEYFGRMGYSVLGIQNELKHINFMLDYNYGNREAASTLLVADAIVAMQHVYPRDRDMPKLLYSAITTLQRMDAPEAKSSQARLRSLLTIEYQDSPEARKVLTPDTSPR
jgi:hypothetical protein